MGLIAFGPQIHDVFDDREEILGPNVHDILGDIHVKLAVDAEPTDLAQAITIDVEEFLLEQGAGFFHLGRIAGAKTTVNFQQCGFVFRDFGEKIQMLRRQRIENQGVGGIGDDPDDLQLGSLDRLDCRADLHPDPTKLLTGIGINDHFRRIVLGLDLLDFYLIDVVEQLQQLVRRAVFLIQGAKEGGGGNFRGLVDSHRQHVFLGHLEFDPRAALRNDARRMKGPVAHGRGDLKIHAGRSMKLADDDALGTIDDELTASHHEGNLAEIDLLFRDFGHAFAHKSNRNAERHAVGESKFPTFVRCVSRFIDLVIKVFQPH